MVSQLAFTIILFVILMILIAHVFACERSEKEGHTPVSGGTRSQPVNDDDRGCDITRYIVPTAFT